MRKHGFYISQLRITGADKEAAVIKLEKGLNVITGKPNTGKTFIYECINYIYGKEMKLPVFNENKGYNLVLMEIITNQNIVYTLRRDIFNDVNNIYITQSSIDKIKAKSQWSKYSAKHSAKSKNNISRFLLELIGLPDNILLQKRIDRTAFSSFSYRYMAHFTMVDEVRIIEKTTPVLKPNDYMNWTSYKSAFKFLLTGNDDSELGEKKKQKYSQVKIKSQISLLEDLIDELEGDLVANTLINIGSNYNLLDEKVILLQDVNKQLQEAYEQKKEHFRIIDELKNESRNTTAIIKRFSLLKEQYKVELERLAFVHEGEYILSQLNDVKCPLCNSVFNDKNEFIYNKETFRDSLNKEYEKIHLKLFDLQQSIDMLLEKEKNNNQKLDELNGIKSQTNLKIESVLIPKLTYIKQEVDDLVKVKESIKEKSIKEEEVRKLLGRKILLENRLESKDVKERNNYIDNDFVDSISTEISRLLKEWNFREDIYSVFDENVIIDKSTYDIIVSEKLGSSYGKGYRAVIYASFLIAFMNDTIEKELYHSGSVIIDSPFTTLAEEEEDKKISDNERVSKNMRESFYKCLSSTVKNEQIIVFENIQPENHDNINHIHFTKNKNEGRYGLFKV